MSVAARPPLVATLILNWNDSEATRRCVESAVMTAYPNQRLYVFDNGASARTRAELAGLAASATMLESPTNLGYTGGNNAAIRRAIADGADFVWLLNNDAVVTPDVLPSLVGLATSDPRLGIVSPLICQEENPEIYQFAGAIKDFHHGLFIDTIDREVGRDWQARLADRFLIFGTAMLIRRTLIERIGELDDRLFAYHEDIDYSLRSLAAGFANRIDFASRVLHRSKPPVPAPHVYYLMTRNELLVWNKHSKGSWLRSRLYAANRVAGLLERLREHGPQLDAALAGLWDGLRGVWGPYDPQRRMPRRLADALKAHPAFVRRVFRLI